MHSDDNWVKVSEEGDVKVVIPQDNCILFFKRDRQTFLFLSNFYPSTLVIDGLEWHCAEQYYQ